MKATFPVGVMLFLLAVHYAQRKQKWSWVNIATLATTLMLLTYSYTIGRVLAPLMALGLLLFARSRYLPICELVLMSPSKMR